MRTPYAVIIPARLASTRLPRKVLLARTGKYLIQHVWERLAPLRQDGAIVRIATDSVEVADAARAFGAAVCMTSPDHPSGTDRVAEAAGDLAAEVLVNVQGDEPCIDPDDVRRLVAPFDDDPGLAMATLGRPRSDARGHADPHIVKIVTNLAGDALYFSRAGIPCPREGAAEWLHHIGVYAYRRAALRALAALAPTALERIERLEQLRALAHGMRVRVVLTSNVYEGIDTPQQYDSFVERYRASGGIPHEP